MTIIDDSMSKLSKIRDFAIFAFVTWAIASGTLQKNDAASWTKWDATHIGSSIIFDGGSKEEAAITETFGSTKIIYPKGSAASTIVNSIKSDINTLPKGSPLPTQIQISPYMSPDDAAYAKQLKLSTDAGHGHIIATTNPDNTIIFYNGRYDKKTLFHEIGHLVDRKLKYLSRKSIYQVAFKADLKAHTSPYGGFATSYAQKYAANPSIPDDIYGEDFAETFAAMYDIDPQDTSSNKYMEYRERLIKSEMTSNESEKNI